MKIYLDVSCLSRPFDDQRQIRIRMEAEGIALIMYRLQAGDWQHISSTMATTEIDAMANQSRRAKVRLLLPPEEDILELTGAVWDRAAQLETLGFKPADAVHLAAAEEGAADVFLSCDDRLCRLATRCRRELNLHVANPIDWLKETDHGPNP